MASGVDSDVATPQRHNGLATRLSTDTPSECTDPPRGGMEEIGVCTRQADELRRRLKYFFMNPCDKFRMKRICPWKLILQLIKIFLVTSQLVMFGVSRGSHIDFLETSTVAFRHLYLKGWDATAETMPYPPNGGAFAIYTIPQFYASVDYALTQYSLTEELAIGTYDFTRENDYMVPVELCRRHYRSGYIHAFNESFLFDSTQETQCFPMLPVQWGNSSSPPTYDTRQYLALINETIDFDRLVDVRLQFAVKTVHLKALTHLNTPDCFLFNIIIRYDNSDHNGQMTVELWAKEIVLPCHGRVLYQDESQLDRVLLSLFDCLVLLVSVLSCSLCVRSLCRAYTLHQHVVRWFTLADPTCPLELSERLELVNLWYVLIILNDALTTCGCVLKIGIGIKLLVCSTLDWSPNGVQYWSTYELCGVLLSTGNLLVWFGVLRYLGFFKKYNVLLMTIKRSAPSVLRFLVCAGLIYLGYVVCGWIVLGPYHIKFRTLSTTCECLFSLISGDDIFTTFAAMDAAQTGAVMWWYSRVYLYTFMSLFIYVVLSVFISVIMDTYDTIKNYSLFGYPRTRLEQFADESRDEPWGVKPFSSPRGCFCTGTFGCCERAREGGVQAGVEDAEGGVVGGTERGCSEEGAGCWCALAACCCCCIARNDGAEDNIERGGVDRDAAAGAMGYGTFA